MNFNFVHQHPNSIPPQYFQYMQVQPQTMQQQSMQRQTISTNPEEIQEPKKRDKWTKIQTKTLVAMWKENLNDIESGKANMVWIKIKAEVDKYGTTKTVKQCKTKIRNLKDTFKKAKENNQKSGSAPNFPEFYDLFDDAIGHRDSVQLPEFTEVGLADTENETVDGQDEGDEFDDEYYKSDDEVALTRKRKSINEEVNVKEKLQKYEEDGEFMSKLEQEKEQREAKKPQKTKEKEASKSFYEQVLNLQKEQLAALKESEQRQHDLLLSILEKQSQSDEKERQKDREFFLELGKLFSK